MPEKRNQEMSNTATIILVHFFSPLITKVKMQTVCCRVGYVLLHETTKPWQVCGDWWNSHDSALSWRWKQVLVLNTSLRPKKEIYIYGFTWCVAPRFIVRRENAEVATSDKLLIIHWQQRRRGWKEFWMEDYLSEKSSGQNELLFQHHG